MPERGIRPFDYSIIRLFECSNARLIDYCPYMRAGLILAIAGALTSRAGAQTCDSVRSRTSLAELSGQRVRSVRVETHAPEPLPGIAGVFDHLHIRTRESTIQRQLLIAPGDTVDTLRVGESLRRLRQLRYIGDEVIVGTRCGPGPTDLLVVTQDLWSVKPTLAVGSTSQSVGFTERNVFGTGREASVGVKSDLTGLGVSAGLHDPWFLGRPLALDLASTGDGERGVWSAEVQNHERSILDPWGVRANVAGAAFDAETVHDTVVDGLAVESLRRMRGGAFITRRIAVSRRGVLDVEIGGEYDRYGWETPLDGPAIARREFAGGDIGVLRRSVAYDTVTWLLPWDALADVPLSFEGEAVVSGGRDFATGAPAAKLDAWAGKMWMFGRGGLLVSDLWGSGYRESGAWSAATLRGALTYYRAATRGVWTVRAGAERLFNPDPDLLAVLTTDATARAYDLHAPVPAVTVAGAVARDVHLRRLTRSWTLDAGAFVAGSRRDDARIAAVGLGLRLAPSRLGRATARVDFVVPFAHSGDVRARPFVALGISPWLEQDRSRDGRRQ
jgi:hypothetical protein